jgi:recombination protein RecT
MSNQVAVVNEVRSAIEKMSPQFKAALPAHIPVERFIRTTLTAVQTNPALMSADRRTLFASATRAAQMGLLPDGREGAIVTFGQNCQFMPMVAGILKLVRNSGELASIDAQIVYKNDGFQYRPGIDLVPQHTPDWFGERGEVVGVYAVAKMKDGAAYVEILSHKQVEQVRNVSRAKNSGPWVTWWDEMARKTAIRRLTKRLPLSTDIDGVLKEDDELFMPEQAAPEAAQAPEAPSASKRPSRLQKVAEQAPAPAEEKHWHDSPGDDDGVIDMPTTDAAGQQPTEEHDSPI